MLTNANIVHENVCIEGPGRILEGVLAYPDGRPVFSALIAGPHPFLGGDMRNNVVTSLLGALASQGAVALAFNYGGVGDSEGGPADWPKVMSAFWKDGTFDEENDWLDDTHSAMKTLRQWCHRPPIFIGYSFGCWTVAKNLQGSGAEAIILISANPKQHAFDQLSECPAPLLLIHSDNDFTCSVTETIAWFDSIRQPKTRIQMSAGEHFFRGSEEELASVVVEFLRNADIARSEKDEDDHNRR